MAIDTRRIYFGAVLGGIGGLLGWAGTVLVQSAVADSTIYVKNVAFGAVIGACIGALIGCTEGLIESRSARRTLSGAVIGAIIGGIGGVVGLVLGEWLFNVMQGGVWPRALGWAIMGLLVGTADGIARWMPSRILYGAIGGFIGGMLGGGSLDKITDLMRGRTGDLMKAQAWGSAIGLVLVGLFIGAMIGLVESLLRVAWVRFLNGRFEGQSRTLDPARAVTTLGSSDACHIILRGDRSVADIHAEIVSANGVFTLRTRNGPVTVDRGGPLPPAMSYELRSGDRLQLGSLRLIFQAEEKKAS
jgi:hypothetical protein